MPSLVPLADMEFRRSAVSWCHFVAGVVKMWKQGRGRACVSQGAVYARPWLRRCERVRSAGERGVCAEEGSLYMGVSKNPEGSTSEDGEGEGVARTWE